MIPNTGGDDPPPIEEGAASGEEEFEVEVNIRQIEQHDEIAVKSLIYEGICVSSLNKIVMNNMERPLVLCGIGLSAIVINWFTGGLILSLVISVLVIPFFIYIFLRYGVLTRFKYKYLEDVTNGVYKYWSEHDSGRNLWVAECTGRIVGCVAIETLSPMVVELKRLCVDVEWQCMGIGGRLADFAMDHVKQRHFKEVVTDTYSVNPEAGNLFNKIGFKNTGSKKGFLGCFTLESFTFKVQSRSRSSLTENESLL